MKPRLDPSQTVGLYAVVLVFLFSVYLLGLVIGKTLDGDAPPQVAASVGPAAAGPEVARELEFYRDVVAPDERAPGERGSDAGRESRTAEAAPPGDPQPLETSPSVASSVVVPEPEVEAEPEEVPVPPESRPDEPAVEAEPATFRESVAAGGYAVQIGALRSREEALILARRAEERGHRVEIREPLADEFFRVWVGRGADREEAQGMEKELERNGFPTFLVRVPDSGPMD